MKFNYKKIIAGIFIAVAFFIGALTMGSLNVQASGTYTLETGERFTFLYTKPVTNELFQYVNGETIIEGTITIAEDKKTIYLYIENDPYNKVTDADKERYDTTFGIYYPPDFYLRGDFSNPNKIVINDLYHHTESPSEVEDSTWVFGTYSKN